MVSLSVHLNFNNRFAYMYIITNGTDVKTAAKAAEDQLNDIFDTMIG